MTAAVTLAVAAAMVMVMAKVMAMAMAMAMAQAKAKAIAMATATAILVAYSCLTGIYFWGSKTEKTGFLRISFFSCVFRRNFS